MDTTPIKEAEKKKDKTMRDASIEELKAGILDRIDQISFIRDEIKKIRIEIASR